MYIPTAFRIQDPEKLAGFIEQHSFATLVTQSESGPFASHLPLLLDRASNRLLGHMARANPQWEHFAEGGETLAVFHGPHAYISPRWYRTAPAVPTWNYAVVHVQGSARVIADEPEVARIVHRTIRFYEGDGPEAWDGNLPAEYEARMLRGIVAFEVAITRWEGKFKLGQNRDKADINAVRSALSQSTDQGERRLADLMKQEGWVE
ncbi:MAG: FMN-binding negative transcriptional regulator [Verrucomicrobia bacterium]|nr:FMN-binding negative transcriptional regulator [Verrucomicrobiota bacterium]MBI3869095.1 FMN-binding negative transcriptional regulator [Verrucomicrobiota bacterium]